MEFRYCLPLALGFLLPVSPAEASPVRIVYSSQAQGVNSSLIQLKLGPGSGINISLPQGETIKKVWLDDLSQIGLSFDGNLCQWTPQQPQQQQQEGCSDEDAAMVHLHQIKWINFRHITHSPDGGTLLTVRAQGVSGRKTYLFKIVPIAGLSEFSNLDILSDSSRPPQLLSDTWSRHSSTPTSTDIPPQDVNSNKIVPSVPALPVQPRDDSVIKRTAVNMDNSRRTTDNSKHGCPLYYEKLLPLKKNTDVQSEFPPSSTNAVSSLPLTNNATTLAFGLLAGIQTGQIKPGSKIWEQAQAALSHLRRGESIHSALSASQLNPSVFNYFLTLGAQPSQNLVSTHQDNSVNVNSSSSSIDEKPSSMTTISI